MCNKRKLKLTLILIYYKITKENLKGTLVGKTVKIVSVLKEIDRKKLIFDVEVFEDGVIVGTGTHTRFIIDPVKFYEKLKNTK